MAQAEYLAAMLTLAAPQYSYLTMSSFVGGGFYCRLMTIAADIRCRQPALHILPDTRVLQTLTHALAGAMISTGLGQYDDKTLT